MNGSKYRSESNYKNSQYYRQEELICSSDIFSGDKGGGIFRKKHYPFVLQDGNNNLYEPIRDEIIAYFKKNKIAWWDGTAPSNHTLSSQIACLNHLFTIRKDKTAVLALLNRVRDEFEDVLPVECDDDPQYISFEVVSTKDHLNEKTSTRGSNCTSVDALIYAVHRGDKRQWLIPIEWKYTECYGTKDLSRDGRKGEVRLGRYSALIDASPQLKSMDNYRGSIYYQEPFYQLMRQTLWAENIIRHRDEEILKADDYLHIHVIPTANDDLLNKQYHVSNAPMETTWRKILNDPTKYVIIDPKGLFKPIVDSYPELSQYLEKRYW